MSNGSGTNIGYGIQVRSIALPRVFGKQIVTKEWSELHHYRGPGVPNPVWSCLADEQGLLAYETAMALMAWAAAESGGFTSALEFRLVKKELKYEFTVTVKGVGEVVDFHEMERAAVFVEEKPAAVSA